MKFKDIKIGMMLSMTDKLTKDPKIQEKRFFLITSKTNDVIETLSVLKGEHSLTLTYTEADKNHWDDDRFVFTRAELISSLREVIFLVFDDNYIKDWVED